MSKRKTAIFLLSVLVALNATFFLLKKEVKADVQPYTFLYSTRYTAIQDTGAINERYQLTAEINISANHEVSGRYSVWFFYDTSSTANITLVAKNITADGGQIDNVSIDSGVCSFSVLVTGQKEVKVRVTGASNNRTSLFQVDGISFSGTDTNNNPISDTTSLYGKIVHIDDELGLINSNLTDIDTMLHQLLSMNIPIESFQAYGMWSKYGTLSNEFTYFGKTLNFPGVHVVNDLNQNYDINYSFYIKNNETLYMIYYTSFWKPTNNLVDEQGNTYYFELDQDRQVNGYKCFIQKYTNNTGNDKYYTMGLEESSNYYVIPIYFGTHLPSNIAEMWGLPINNTYTQNQNTIISKIQELINGNSNTQQSVNNNDQTTNQLQQQSDQYHQIESTFQSSFNTEQTQIKEQLNVNPMTSFSKTALWFTDQLTNLYNRSGNFKILFTLPLILGLAMYFIGRGRKVAAPNTVEHYTLVESGDAGEGRTVYKTTRSTARRRAFRDRSKT